MLLLQFDSIIINPLHAAYEQSLSQILQDLAVFCCVSIRNYCSIVPIQDIVMIKH